MAEEELKKMDVFFIIISIIGAIFFYQIVGSIFRAFDFGDIVIWGSSIFSFFIFFGFLKQQEEKNKAHKNLAEMNKKDKSPKNNEKNG